MWLSAQRQWAERRAPGADMSRLYVAEAMLSCTGMMADHRLRTRTSDIAQRRPRAPRRGHAAAAAMPATPRRRPGSRRWPRISAPAGGDAVVVVGPRQPAAVHALVHAINAALKSNAVALHGAGRWRSYEPLLGARRRDQGRPRRHARASPPGTRSTRRRATSASTSSLGKVPNAIYLAPLRGRDGAARGVDPAARARARELGRCPHRRRHGRAAAAAHHAAVQRHLASPSCGRRSSAKAARAATTCCARPTRRSTRLAFQRHAAQGRRRRQRADQGDDGAADGAPSPARPTSSPRRRRGLELNFVPDYKVFDGRYANNVWLQELPDPVTKLTWDNALMLSPATGRSD